MSTALVAPSNAKPSGVDKLRATAASASQVRALSTHPDVVALRVESIRKQVDVLMWLGIVLGLAFTMVNVQAFAAQGAAVLSLPWFAAWLLDPMVSLVLIAVLRAEQVTARYQVRDAGKWISRTKRFAFAATYAMNTWASLHRVDLAGIVLHSVPPLLVYCAAETGPVLRDRLTEAVLRAEQAAALANPTRATEPLTDPATPLLESPNPAPVEPAATAPAPAPKPNPATRRPARKPAQRPAGKRTGKTTGKDKARAHWDAELAGGREPSGGELARVADVDPSLGRRWARDWKTENTPTAAADITPAATTENPQTDSENETSEEAA
ncbi:hypothetical protein ACXC9Q_18735 [Kribbella sp. CWNU-51]